MNSRGMLATTLTCLAACGGPEADDAFDEALETDAAEIAVGTNDVSNPTRDAVVLISGAAGSCTATLVSPTVLVTAAHCGFSDPTYADGNWHRLPTAVTVQFGPDRTRPTATYVAREVSTPPLAGPPWPDDIALLRLTSAVPASIAVPRPMLVDRPADLSPWTTVIHQVGYGGGRNRRFMTGRSYRDWTTSSAILINGFEYTADVRGPGIGTRDTNVEGGDSGGPMLIGGVDGPVMGVLSFWQPYGIATFGPGGAGRSDVRGWLRRHVPQAVDLSVVSVFQRGCTGSGGVPVVGVTVRNTGSAAVASTRVDVLVGGASPPSVGSTSGYRLTLTNLLPRETRTVSVPVGRDVQLMTTGAGAVIDTLRAVVESSETNNVGFATLAFPDCSFN